MNYSEEETLTKEEVWDKLSYFQKLCATAYIFERLVDHMDEGGTYGYLIFDRLGFEEGGPTDGIVDDGIRLSDKLKKEK